MIEGRPGHNLEIIQLQLPQTMFGIPLTKWAPRALSFTKSASRHLFFVLLVDLPDSIDLFAFGNPDKIMSCKAILASKLLQGSGECPQRRHDLRSRFLPSIPLSQESRH